MKMKNKQSGFSMIEVMTTAVVLVIGISGVTKLQMVTLSTLSNTNQHFLAASLAHDMGERIRTNFQSAALYADKKSNSVADCSNFECNLQEQDLWLWSQALKDDSQALPSAIGSITENGNNMLVTITWDEKSILADAVSQSYTLEVAYR